MQEVTAFLTSRYRFRFNVLTEETEVADVANITNIENNLPDAHLRYAKVDERWMNRTIFLYVSKYVRSEFIFFVLLIIA